jgi:hypothetical protein
MSLSPKKNEKGIINDEVEKDTRGVHVLHEILAIYSTSSKGIRYPRFLIFLLWDHLIVIWGSICSLGLLAFCCSTVVISTFHNRCNC